MKTGWLTPESLGEMVRIVDSCRQVQRLQAELNWNQTSLKNAMESARVLGAFIGEQLVAFVLFAELGDALEIWCLATDPEFQGQGVMGTLLNEIKGLGKEIWLEVHERNHRALKFYKDKGFQQVGIRKRYYEDGGDAHLFSWSSEKH